MRECAECVRNFCFQARGYIGRHKSSVLCRRVEKKGTCDGKMFLSGEMAAVRCLAQLFELSVLQYND